MPTGTYQTHTVASQTSLRYGAAVDTFVGWCNENEHTFVQATPDMIFDQSGDPTWFYDAKGVYIPAETKTAK